MYIFFDKTPIALNWSDTVNTRPNVLYRRFGLQYFAFLIVFPFSRLLMSLLFVYILKIKQIVCILIDFLRVALPCILCYVHTNFKKYVYISRLSIYYVVYVIYYMFICFFYHWK